MNKFAKYVPEEDKKKQREHIGAIGYSVRPGEIIAYQKSNVGYWTSNYPTMGWSVGVDPNDPNGRIAVNCEPFIPGNSYTVIWDGRRYENLVASANSEIGAEVDDSGHFKFTESMPFMIASWSENYTTYLYVCSTLSGNYHSIEIIADDVIYNNSNMLFYHELNATSSYNILESSIGDLTDDYTYTVIWDNHTYENLKSVKGYIESVGDIEIQHWYIGSIITEDGLFSGLPFEIDSYTMSNGISRIDVRTISTEPTHDICIIANGEVVDTLDPTYLPKANVTDCGIMSEQDVLRIVNKEVYFTIGTTTYGEVCEFARNIENNKDSKSALMHISKYYGDSGSTITYKLFENNHIGTRANIVNGGTSVQFDAARVDSNNIDQMCRLHLEFENPNEIPMEEWNDRLVLTGVRWYWPKDLYIMSSESGYDFKGPQFRIRINDDGELQIKALTENDITFR